jgi:hypothetical protein
MSLAGWERGEIGSALQVSSLGLFIVLFNLMLVSFLPSPHDKARESGLLSARVSVYCRHHAPTVSTEPFLSPHHRELSRHHVLAEISRDVSSRLDSPRHPFRVTNHRQNRKFFGEGIIGRQEWRVSPPATRSSYVSHCFLYDARIHHSPQPLTFPNEPFPPPRLREFESPSRFRHTTSRHSRTASTRR